MAAACCCWSWSESEARATAAVGGVPTPSQPEPAQTTQQRIASAFANERKKVKTAEHLKHKAEVEAAYDREKYEEAHAQNEALHNRHGEWQPAAPAPVQSSSETERLARAKRKVHKLVHPDKIADHLKTNAGVREHSTSLSQGVDACFE